MKWQSFNIPALVRKMKEEEVWHIQKHNSRVIHKSQGSQVTLVVMHAVTRILGHETKTPVCLYVAEGSLKLIVDGKAMALEQGHLLTLDAGVKHELEAMKESTFLLIASA